MGWNHCYKCKRSFGRFWFRTDESFFEEAERDIPCPWCNKTSEIHHRLDDAKMPNSKYAISM